METDFEIDVTKRIRKHNFHEGMNIPDREELGTEFSEEVYKNEPYGSGKTIKEAILQTLEELGIHNVKLNYVYGRDIFVKLLEDEYGDVPTETEIEMWKNGELLLYAAYYYFKCYKDGNQIEFPPTVLD